MMAALHAGRANALAFACDPTCNDQGKPFVRTIARALERHMMKDPECAVHWICPIDEPSSFGPPTAVWDHDEDLLQVGLVEGNSEGMLIYVHAQASRSAPSQLVPLLRIKVLCSAPRAAMELLTVWKWLHSGGLQAVLRPPAAATGEHALEVPA